MSVDTVDQVEKEKVVHYQARHWNGNQVCSIDLETSGLDPLIHEILQLAILPLDQSYKPRRDVPPLYINILPESPDCVDYKHISRKKYLATVAHGFHVESAKEVFYQWYKKLRLPVSKYGRPKRIIPLGHNFNAHDRNFLLKWLGREEYDLFFSPLARDTMTASLFVNDRDDMHNEDVHIVNLTLTATARRLNIDTFGAHDALIDAKITAEVYHRLTKMGVF